MHIWAVANQKGGVGKTTTSIALAGIAAAKNQRVLLVDLDPHGSLTSYFKIKTEDLKHSSYDLFQSRKKITYGVISKSIKVTGYQNMDLIPAVTALATLERQGIGDGMGLVLNQALKHLEYEYDRILVDCPPQLGVLMINALACCEQLIVPTQTEFLAIQGLERMLSTLAMLKKSMQKNLPYTIVPTMYDRRTQACVTSLRTIRNDYGDAAWPGKVPIDTRFRDSSKAGVPPHIFDPDSRGVSAYESLFNYLIERTDKAAKSEMVQGVNSGT